MPAAARSVSARRGRRGVGLGSLLGMILLAASVVAAPAAVAGAAPASGDAAEQSHPDEPEIRLAADFGVPELVADGSDITLALAPVGPVPTDLDLSGARFRVSDWPFGIRSHVCVTDQRGQCLIRRGKPGGAEGASLRLGTGFYTVAQTTGVVGLELDTQKVMIFVWPVFKQTDTATFANDSLFRQSVVTTVVERDSGTPVAGAEYGLTGPNYPRRAGVPSSAGGSDPEYDAGTQTSGADGVLQHTGFFLPGTWTLTPGTTPPGFLPGEPTSFDLATSAQDALDGTPFDTRLTMVPDPPAEEPPVDDPPADDPPAEAPPAEAPPAEAPPAEDPPADNPPAEDPPAGLPGSGGPPAGGAGQPGPGQPGAGPTPETEESPPAPGPAGPGPTPPSTGPGENPLVGPAPVAIEESPALETVGADLTVAGVLTGIGVLFVAAVLVAFAFLRRRRA